jgi:hypothetical protein
VAEKCSERGETGTDCARTLSCSIWAGKRVCNFVIDEKSTIGAGVACAVRSGTLGHALRTVRVVSRSTGVKNASEMEENLSKFNRLGFCAG